MPKHAWGLPAPGELGGAALRAQRLWRWPVLLALMATIPAFYIELLEELPTAAAVAIYLLAAVLLAGELLHVLRHCAAPKRRLLASGRELLLILGLVLAALLPPSVESHGALAARLLVALLVLARLVWMLRAWFTRGSIPHLLTMSLVVLVFSGLGFWALEPRVSDLGDGMWLAFTTAATVGYGDIVPSTPAAKIFAVFVVLLGYAMLSLVTAAIAAFWVEASERRLEADILRELHAELQALRAEVKTLRQDMNR